MKKILVLILGIVLFSACNSKQDTEHDELRDSLHRILANEISIYQNLEGYEYDVKMFEMQYNLEFAKFDYEFTKRYVGTDNWSEKKNLMNEANDLKMQMMAIRREIINAELFDVEKAKKTIKLFEDFVIEYKTK